MPLTTTQRTWVRNSLGDTGTSQAFTDGELDSLYDMASADATTGESALNRAVWYGYEQLAANAAKLSDYTQNATDEKRSQIFGQINKMLEYWRVKVATITAANVSQKARFVGVAMKERPKDEPQW